MKKLFIIFTAVTVFMLCGCINENITEDIPTQEKIPWDRVTEFEYKGHKYIKFMSTYGSGYAGVVHNPECKCQHGNKN